MMIDQALWRTGELKTMEKEMHIPVMQKEILEHLNLRPGSCVVDCTLGLGGHAAGILKAVGKEGRLIGIDRDSKSIEYSKERLKDFSSQCDLIKSDFRHIDEVLNRLQISEVDGILFDLGVSSYQMESSERGFSIRSDGPLDMRMDQESYISAYDLVNSLPEKEISSILKNFGEERWHNRIAAYLVRERAKNPIETTRELSDVVLKAIPRRFQHERIHPATRTFQAFRIAVNRELEALEIALNLAVEYLKEQARICVISFHSLEDRIVKEKFRNFAKEEGKLRLITKKPLEPGEEEIKRNPRARSAKLRVAERII